MNGLEDISDVEKLKIFRAIRIGCKDDIEFREYLSYFCKNDEIDEYIRRTQGYFNEDEFAVVCYLLGCCKRITPLSQTPLPKMEKGTPDYLVTFKTKYGDLSCFIEVKSTSSYRTSSFSPNAIKRIDNYAKEYGLPLFFASRLSIGDCGVWILQTHDEFFENKRRSSIEELPNVIGNVLMNDMFVTVTSGFKMELTFTDNENENENENIRYEKYGRLTGINITVDEHTISFDDVLMLDILFSTFAEETDVRKTSSGYKVFKEAKAHKSLPLSCILLHLNTVLSDENKIKIFSNPSRLIAQIESNNGLTIEFDKFIQMILAIRGSFPEHFKNNVFDLLLIGDNDKIKKSNQKILKEIKRQKEKNKTTNHL